MIEIIEIIKGKNQKYTVKIKNDLEIEEYQVSETVILKFNYLKPKPITDRMYQDFILEYNLDVFYQKILKFVLFKPRTKKEIIDKLKTYGISNKVLDEIVSRLKTNRMFDDEIYFKNFIDESVNYRKDGPLLIEKKLKEKGILINTRDYVLESVFEGNIYELIDKVDQMNQKYPVIKRRQKITAYLYSKGYDLELINQSIGKYSFKDEGENKLLEEAYFKAKKKFSEQDRTKIIRYLVARGFKINDVLKIINQEGNDND